MIWRTARSSANSRGSDGSNCWTSLMSLLRALSSIRWQHSSTIALQHHRLLVELVATGLDPRQVEDLVDQVEQVPPGVVDVVGIFAVGGVLHGAEHFLAHHLREAEDGVERRAQLVAHGGEKARLGEVGVLGAPPCLLRHRLGGLDLGQQRILLGAEGKQHQRGTVQLVGDIGEEGQRGDQHRHHQRIGRRVAAACRTRCRRQAAGRRSRPARRAATSRPARWRRSPAAARCP